MNNEKRGGITIADLADVFCCQQQRKEFPEATSTASNWIKFQSTYTNTLEEQEQKE